MIISPLTESKPIQNNDKSPYYPHRIERCDRQRQAPGFIDLVIQATRCDAMLRPDQAEFLRAWVNDYFPVHDTRYSMAAEMARWIHSCVF